MQEVIRVTETGGGVAKKDGPELGVVVVSPKLRAKGEQQRGDEQIGRKQGRGERWRPRLLLRVLVRRC